MGCLSSISTFDLGCDINSDSLYHIVEIGKNIYGYRSLFINYLTSLISMSASASNLKVDNEQCNNILYNDFSDKYYDKISERYQKLNWYNLNHFDYKQFTNI